MLRLRRAELATRIAADAAALSQVEARLRTIEREGRMHTDEVVIKKIDAVRVVELTGIAASYGPQHIGPVIQPLYMRLMSWSARPAWRPPGRRSPTTRSRRGEGIVVHAGVPAAADREATYPFAVVDLPAIEAATVIHRGTMDAIGGTLDGLARWIEESGYEAVGLHREVYLDASCADQSDWVTEIQESITRT